MTPLVVENELPVIFLRRKMTGGRFSMGVVIRRYTGTIQTVYVYPLPNLCSVQVAYEGQFIHILRDWILLVCFSWRYEATEGPSAFRNLHVDPLSLHTSMRNKQVEFNPYIYTLTTLSKLYRFGYEISVFNTKHPVIILRASLFVVTPSHVTSWKIECQIFSYVYRSRKHLECKY